MTESKFKCWLLPAFFLVTAGAAQVRAQDLPERVLRFDPGASIGRVLVRDQGSQGEWRYFGEAWGGAKIPAKTEAGLELKRQSKMSLAMLDALAPTNLQMLVSIGSGIKDEEFTHVKRLTGLRIVRITGSNAGTKAAECIAELAALEELEFSSLKLPWQIGEILSPLQNLRSLSLASSGLTARTFSQFPVFPKLEHLDLSKNQLNDNGLPSVLRSPALKSLNVSHAQLTIDSFGQIAKVTGLSKLQVAETDCDDQCIAQLKGLSGLAELNVRKTRITDTGITELAGFPALTALDLSQCELITDGAITTLKQMKQLRLLGIHQTQISASAVTDLEHALPECMIVSIKNPQTAELAKTFNID